MSRKLALLILFGTAISLTVANAQTSSSVTFTQTVNKATPTITETSSLNPSTFNQSVSFTASAPTSATGTVTFVAGGTTLGSATLSNGTGTISIATLGAGTYSVVAEYSGDSNYLSANSTAVTQTVDKATPGSGGNAAVTVASSLNPSVFGQSVTLTAAVPANATGTVEFMNGGSAIGTGTISGGVASVTTAALTGGSNQITAVYSGDSNYYGATSASLTQTVTVQPVTVGLTSSKNPSYAQEPVTFTATVPAGATGTVQFLNGSTTIGTEPVSGGSAVLSISTLAPGANSITAVYSGDANYGAATSAALTETIDDTSTISEISVAPGSTEPVGTSLTFTALVNTYGDTPTGSVAFSSGSTSLGTGTVSSVTTTNLIPYSNSFSEWTLEEAGVAAPTVTASAATAPNGAGASATQVSFPDTAATGQGGADYSGVSVLSSTGSYAGEPGAFSVWAALPSGSSSGAITLYLADDSTGVVVGSQVCNLTTTWTRCALTGTFPANAGTGFHASIRSWGAAAETVDLWGAQFEQAANPGPFVNTSGTSRTGTGGVATFTTANLLAGTYQVTAAYSGDSNYKTSTSSVQTVTITQATASVALTSSANPSTYGGDVTFTATVTGPETTPTGTVTFKDGSTTLGTGTLNASGVATFSTSSLTGGTHSITAVYSGDSNFDTATSTAVSQVVNAATSTINVSSSANPSTYSEAVTFTVTVSGVSGGVTPTGTVTITDSNGSQVGTGTLSSSGVATITSSTLTAGTHNLTITFSGDGNYL